MQFTDVPFSAAFKECAQGWIDSNIASLGPVAQPMGRSRRVIFTGFTRFGFSGKGKVYTEDYFPKFTHYLAEHDVDCHFVWTQEQMAEHSAHGNYATSICSMKKK
ncbi:MAG: hypothetical protein U5N55_02565 [Cypionkella sp.]|nr:hypothetical protein [Cypionkella sp.]